MNDIQDAVSQEELSTEQNAEMTMTEEITSVSEHPEEKEPESLTQDEPTEEDFSAEQSAEDDSPIEQFSEADASKEETSSYRNLFDDPDFPKSGWECVDMTDHGEEHIVCELCGQKNVRFAHHMHHPQYGDLTVGCICAGKMEGDLEKAKQREREFNRTGAMPLESAVAEIPYHERFYLNYHNGARVTPQDIQGTNAFLKEIGFDGGELRQARIGENLSDDLRNNDNNKNNPLYCSYCGTTIAGVEYYRLPDGRMRCTTCSSGVVKTKAQVEETYQRVITNLDKFFGATIDVPISIEIVEERKLKKKLGIPLGTKDEQSVLIHGVAVNKKKKYSIILENGAPRISLIATFAHELTHIWQYVHWDNQKGFKKCPKSKQLLIYEGMAKWVEIQYLYLIGEITVAKRQEYITRNRQDEYGIGFCLYEDRYPLTREAMTCGDTPFTPNRYPFD